MIRRATAADLPAIGELFNALIPTTTIAWRDHLADEAELAAWWTGQQRGGRPVLVAEDGALVVGYAHWSDFRGGERFPGYRHTGELTIHVARSHHGRGVGRALLTALVDEAAAAGLHVLVAGVDADNAASIALHESLGFVRVAHLPEVGRKFGRWLDLVLLQRILDDATPGR